MTDLADRYRRLASRFTAVVDDVPPDRWDSPSPCVGWTARDVVAHVADTELELVDRLGLRTADGELPAETVDRWRAVRLIIQSLLDDPPSAGHVYDGHFGPTTFGETIDRFYCFDLVVHAWDLARATGLAHHEAIDATDIARIRADAEAMGEALRTPGICGPALPVDAAATMQAALLAFLGRQP